MEDKDIIKALERCGQHRECCYCNSVEECGSKRVLTASALDLINRLKADVNNYRTRVGNQREELARLNEQANEQKAEIEALEMKCENALYNLVAVLDERANRTEAIKEFAERLKKESRWLSKHDADIYGDEIDNLVAEMTEQQKNDFKE